MLEGIKDEIHEAERMLKALIKSLGNKPSNPRPLFPQLVGGRTLKINPMSPEYAYFL